MLMTKQQELEIEARVLRELQAEEQSTELDEQLKQALEREVIPNGRCS